MNKETIHKKIQDNNGKLNSLELGKIFLVTPDFIREQIREINLNLKDFPIGIISKGNKYYLADQQDCASKIESCDKKHKQVGHMKKVWEARADMMFKQSVNWEEKYGHMILKFDGRYTFMGCDYYFETKFEAVKELLRVGADKFWKNFDKQSPPDRECEEHNIILGEKEICLECVNRSMGFKEGEE